MVQCAAFWVEARPTRLSVCSLTPWPSSNQDRMCYQSTVFSCALVPVSGNSEQKTQEWEPFLIPPVLRSHLATSGQPELDHDFVSGPMSGRLPPHLSLLGGALLSIRTQSEGTELGTTGSHMLGLSFLKQTNFP